jgi:hypothetical protein
MSLGTSDVNQRGQARGLGLMSYPGVELLKVLWILDDEGPKWIDVPFVADTIWGHPLSTESQAGASSI